MVEIRLRGLLNQLEALVDTLRINFTVVSVSKPYKDRGDSELYRIYVKVEAIEILE